MASVEDGIASQLRNIESTYGRSIDSWINLIGITGRTRHGEIVGWLKAEHGLSHAAAHRVALVAIDASAPKAQAASPEESLYADGKRELLPIHARLMAQIFSLGTDIETIPKKGYLSVQRPLHPPGPGSVIR